MNKIQTLTTFVALGSAAAFAAVLSSTPAATQTISETPIIDDGVSCVSNDIVSAMFAEGTDPAIIAKVYKMILKPLEEQNQRYFTTGTSGWTGTTNVPANVTYSFPADGITMDAGGGNPNVLHADLTGTFGSEATWKTLFRDVFDRWEEFTNTTYTEVSDDNAGWGASGPIHGGSNRGDIRIWSRFIDGGSNVLAFNFFPSGGVGGDMVLDSADNWGSGASQNFRFFRNVVSHENGHGMGISHVCTDSGHRALMNPFATTAFDGPQHDDIRAMQRLYGDFNEPNNNIGSATDLGFFNPMDTASLFGVSISGSEDDFYGISVLGSSLLNVTVNPTGQSYNMGPQAGNGTCPLGPIFNSQNQHDLRIRVFTAAGVEIATTDDNPAGLPEFMTEANLAGGGDFYVAVDSTDTSSQTQLYNITIEASITLPDGDLNGDCEVDAADLGGLLGSFGSAGPFADINGDGIVDAADLGVLLSNFGTTCDDL